MADEIKVKSVDFVEFKGLVSNFNPHRLEPGELLEAVNLAAGRLGELAVRRGLRKVTFD